MRDGGPILMFGSELRIYGCNSLGAWTDFRLGLVWRYEGQNGLEVNVSQCREMAEQALDLDT